ncbi:MAG: ABC transporter permease [Vicinamibacterales bacterium]
MSLRGLWQRVRSLLRPGRVDDEIAREIAFHLEMEAKARGEAGLSPDEAQREARRRFGGVTQAREEVHDVRGMTFFEMLRQDLKFGLRTLRRSPGYTTAATLILSLGIGANTAMFSVLNGVLLKPLPFTDGHELVLVQHQAKASRFPNVGVSIPELNGYRQRASLVHDLVEYHSMSFTLLNQGEPDRVDTGVVDAGFFDMLGIRPLHGRAFLATDDDLGAEAVLLLSHRYWVEKFGADPKVIGRVLEMNNRPHTVVGVLPDFPEYPRHNDVYMPTSACSFPCRRRAEPGHDWASRIRVAHSHRPPEGRTIPRSRRRGAGGHCRVVRAGPLRGLSARRCAGALHRCAPHARSVDCRRTGPDVDVVRRDAAGADHRVRECRQSVAGAYDRA